jgi:DNA-binding HxlR family transcriptional regulator
MTEQVRISWSLTPDQEAQMPVQRGYRQACGIARGLDVIGERWALLIVRELLLGPKRFTDLRAGLPGASPNALTDRLHELTQAGVLHRRQLPPPAASWVYELTTWGRELEPVVLALGTWALGSPQASEHTFISLDSLMLTIRTYYTGPGCTGPGPAGAPVTLQVQLTDNGTEHRFGVWLHATAADVRHELPDRPTATITTDTATLIAALGDHDQPPAALTATMTIDGDPQAVHQLLNGIFIPGPPPTGTNSPR